ncbi:hypothetical protein ACWEQ7_30710 [Streptomyces sp. NPDC004069]
MKIRQVDAVVHALTRGEFGRVLPPLSPMSTPGIPPAPWLGGR